MKTPTYNRYIQLLAVSIGSFAFAHAADAMPRSSVASVFPFDLTRNLRYFDGVELTTVVLASPKATLMTDTMGAWIPLDHPNNSAGFTMRHHSLPGVAVNISLLDAAAESESAQSWKDYVAMVQQQLGDNSSVAEESDSAVDPRVVRVLGGRTRQARFSANTREPVAEYHVITTLGRSSVVFILSGPADEVPLALNDFRFFLSRLERVTP